jgi:Fe-S-cluster containining protein
MQPAPARDPFASLPPDAAELASRWAEAAFHPAIDAGIRELYAEVARETAALAPTCNASGRCCRFGEWGHLLYVTGLEAAWCIRESARTPTAADVRAAAGRDDCPFLESGLCAVHLARPLGCRAYFCDPRAEGWQEALSERMLARLRALHDAHRVPYRYGEWRTMLAHFAAGS